MLFWLLPLLSASSAAVFWLWNARLCRACDARLLEGEELLKAARYRHAMMAFDEGHILASRILMGRGDRAILCALGSAEALKRGGDIANAYEAALTAFMLCGERPPAPYSLRLYTLLADLSVENGYPHRAIGLRQAAVAMLRRSEPGSQALAEQLAKLGQALGSAGLTEHSAKALSDAAEVLRERAAEDPELNGVYADVLVQLGSVSSKLGDYQQADQSLRAALPVAVHKVPVLRELGVLHCAWSRFDEAFAFFEEAYRIQVRASGPSDTEVGLILSSYADGLRKAGRLDAAEETAARAVRLLEVNQHPAVVSGLGTLATVLLAEGNYSRAVEVFERADEASSIYRANPLDTAERLESHAVALEALHRALDAEQMRTGASSIRSALASAPPAEELFDEKFDHLMPES